MEPQEKTGPVKAGLNAQYRKLWTYFQERFQNLVCGSSCRCAQHVLRLRKCLYGLKQAARISYQTLDSLLKQFQFRRVVVDYGVGIQHETNTLILAHVDDMILIGSRSDLDALKPKINAVYSFKDLGLASLFLGIMIIRDCAKRCIYLN